MTVSHEFNFVCSSCFTITGLLMFMDSLVQIIKALSIACPIAAVHFHSAFAGKTFQ